MRFGQCVQGMWLAPGWPAALHGCTAGPDRGAGPGRDTVATVRQRGSAPLWFRRTHPSASTRRPQAPPPGGCPSWPGRRSRRRRPCVAAPAATGARSRVRIEIAPRTGLPGRGRAVCSPTGRQPMLDCARSARKRPLQRNRLQREPPPPPGGRRRARSRAGSVPLPRRRCSHRFRFAM